MARHSGDTILRYVQEAPLEQLTSLTRRKLHAAESGSCLPGVIGGLAGDEARLRTHCEGLETAMKENLRSEVENLRERLALEDKPRQTTHEWVRNADSGIVHRVLVADMAVPAACWRTSCGWKFGTKRFRLCAEPGSCPKAICEICAPAEKLLAEA